MRRIHALFCLFSTAAALTVLPPENQVAKVGDPVTLTCSASHDLKTCTWLNPNGDALPMFVGTSMDDGRIETAHKEDEVTKCAIRINKVEAKDTGRWTCSVSKVENGQLLTAQGHGNLTLAQAPTSVVLDGDFDLETGIYNVTETEKVQKVNCEVAGARPAPEVKWFVDDLELKVKSALAEMEDKWISSINYEPKREHENKTLRCVVNHMSLAEEMESRVTLILALSEETGASTQEVNVGSICGVIAALVTIMVVLACLVKCFGPRETGDDVDAEKAEIAKDNEAVPKDSENDSGKETDSNKTESEAKTDKAAEEESKEKTESKVEVEVNGRRFTARFGERFASFFNMRSNNAEKDEVKVESETEVDAEKTSETKTESDAEEKKSESGEEKEPKVKVEIDGKKADVTIEVTDEVKVKFGAPTPSKSGARKRFDSLLNLFKRGETSNAKVTLKECEEGEAKGHENEAEVKSEAGNEEDGQEKAEKDSAETEKESEATEADQEAAKDKPIGTPV